VTAIDELAKSKMNRQRLTREQMIRPHISSANCCVIIHVISRSRCSQV